MKKLYKFVDDILLSIGVILLSIGTFLIFVPVGFIATGAFFVALAYLYAQGKAGDDG